MKQVHIIIEAKSNDEGVYGVYTDNSYALERADSLNERFKARGVTFRVETHTVVN